jgi:hypothetical protein
VVARYLTVGTATVDVVEDPVFPSGGAAAVCAGCAVRRSDMVTDSALDWFGGSSPDADREALAACVARMREWAQSHAETCRAMPRTSGGAA